MTCYLCVLSYIATLHETFDCVAMPLVYTVRTPSITFKYGKFFTWVIIP